MLQNLISLVELSALFISLKLISFAFRWLQQFIALSRLSHPLSRFLRPFAEAKRFRLLIGANLALSALIVNQLSPVGGAGPFAFANTSTNPPAGGPAEIAVLTNRDIQVITETTFRFPIGETQGYSQGFSVFHPGVDIRTRRGAPIHPIANGKVVEVEYGRWAYGHKVVIEHEHGLTSLYAHQDEINVQVGDQVSKDAVIGNVGLTGWTTGPHLHLEIKNVQGYLNPKQLLPELN